LESVIQEVGIRIPEGWNPETRVGIRNPIPVVMWAQIATNAGF